MRLVSACSCLCAIYWSQVLSGEWRCSWSSAERRCCNYIWVIGNLIAYLSAPYIRDLTFSLCNGAIPCLLEAGCDGPAISYRSHLKMLVRNRWLQIHIFHGFASKLHILRKSGNIVHWVCAYRRCCKPENGEFMKSWEKYAASFDDGRFKSAMVTLNSLMGGQVCFSATI